MYLAILIALIAAPPVLLFLLKSSPPAAFLSLCAGALLAIYAGDDLVRQVDGVAPQWADGNAWIVVLVVVPVIASLFLMRKSVLRRSKFLIQIVPALCTGLLLAILVVDNLSPSLRVGFTSLDLWRYLHNGAATIVAAGAITSLFFLWLKPLKRSPKHK